MTKISSYTTIRNPVLMDYPFAESIRSMMPFSKEVCVLDSSDKDDGTLDILSDISKEFPGKLKTKKVGIDWKAPNHGVFDGQTKQMAREMCSENFLFQFDSDEIVHEQHSDKIPKIIEKIGSQWQQTPLLNLPVVEYWGSKDKVRIDVNLWKWRISVNSGNIKHGIPKELRCHDPVSGLLYAKQGTDGCNYVNKIGEGIQSLHFIPNEIEILKLKAVKDMKFVKPLEQWFDATLDEMPGVFHYSWFNIERKIKQYRMFWSDFWKAMYNLPRDERDNPFFPGRLWSEVSDNEITESALWLELYTNGWIFHSPWDGTHTNGINIKMNHPEIMKTWIEKHKP